MEKENIVSDKETDVDEDILMYKDDLFKNEDDEEIVKVDRKIFDVGDKKRMKTPRKLMK